MFIPRLLVGPSTIYKATRMGIVHGRSLDCEKPGCYVCEPYRKQENEEWQKLTEEEKSLVVWGRLGL